ncbi:ACP S-malonyltransferase [Ideonella sp. 4Y11]|uniref:Malonyl CoA-acyl carrier protein transacylase n=1 Tax=Ideonella aquatica TaxID=2824119 RepID=A0A941BHT8_9BURK|nr:ACP S-malonyltransferase [Ideonella aquatica]MBQ0957957.1 ACP S-malonyltransferase [Ideonella aquatica]
MKRVWLFPGQGSQEPGMGDELLRDEPAAADLCRRAGERLGVDLRRLMADGPRASLAATAVAQTAIFALSVATAGLLGTRGLRPVAVAGHSLGQFSAAVACGALDVDTALDLVVARGRLMHEVNQRVDGGMLAVAAPSDGPWREVLDRAAAQVWIANRNAPGQTVLAGLLPDLRRLYPALAATGARLSWLQVAGPYHTPLFAEASARFDALLEAAQWHAPCCPLLGNADGRTLEHADDLRQEFLGHMLRPVDWVATMAGMGQLGVDGAVEVGPGRTLKGLALRQLPHLRCVGTGTAAERQALLAHDEETACALS